MSIDEAKEIVMRAYPTAPIRAIRCSERRWWHPRKWVIRNYVDLGWGFTEKQAWICAAKRARKDDA